MLNGQIRGYRIRGVFYRNRNNGYGRYLFRPHRKNGGVLEMRNKPKAHPFQWYEDKVGRGKPVLEISNRGMAWFVQWSTCDGLADEHFLSAAIGDNLREDGFPIDFERLAKTKQFSNKTLIMLGNIGMVSYAKEGLAKLIYDLVEEKINKALKIVVNVFEEAEIPNGYNRDFHNYFNHIKLVDKYRNRGMK